MANVYKDKRSIIVQNTFLDFKTGELLSPIETEGYTVVQIAESYFIGGFSTREHLQHCDLEITLPITGSLYSSADGSEERVEKNRVYLSFRDELHALSSKSSCRFLTLALNFKKSTGDIFSELRARFIKKRTLGGFDASEIMAKISSEFLGERREHFRIYLDALVSELLVSLLRFDNAPSRAPRPYSADCLPEIMNYIDCNFLKICSPEELSQFGYSYHYISRLIKETYGTSPGAYLTAKRMDYAERLLSDGRSVLEVSQVLGYSSPFNFSRAYKKHFGYPPSRAKV